jgi:hypothetical protein
LWIPYANHGAGSLKQKTPNPQHALVDPDEPRSQQ